MPSLRRTWTLALLLGWSIMTAAKSAYGAPPDPPRAAEAPAGSVTLRWTAPGDDGMDGAAIAYDLRYSTQPITDANFYFAIRVPHVGPPLDPGTLTVTAVPNLFAHLDYYFAIKTADEAGNWSLISNIAIHTATSTVGVGDGPAPLAFSAPFPNPSRYWARFELSLPQAALVRVEAFDLTGRRVRLLLNQIRPAGPGEVTWDLRDDQGSPIRAGIYLVRATLPGRVVTRRAVVVR